MKMPPALLQVSCHEPQWPYSKHSYFLHVVRDESLAVYICLTLSISNEDAMWALQELIYMKCLHKSVCV